MKLLNKQIDMISWTSCDGIVTPVRFRMEENGRLVIVRVGRILQSEKKQFCGIPMLCFRCSSIVRGTEKIYELAYNCGSQQWLLKKM